MKIIQVATLISPEGAYGGPVRVAVNQTRQLIAAGHDVILAAGAQGYGKRLPSHFDGVPVKLFEAHRMIPKTGFSGLMAPGLIAWLKTAAKTADVVHVHMGRDLVTLPATLRLMSGRVPYVLQTHGMVQPSRHPLAGIVDAFGTKPALSRAGKVFFLTQTERRGLTELAGTSLQLQELLNGVPKATMNGALSQDSEFEVLFLARLHERKRPLLFIDMARALHPKFPNVRFVLVGPDEGMGSAVSRAIREAAMGDRLTWEGAIDPEKTGHRIHQASIFVLPSIDEPFPMSVLEALSFGKPVIITDTCGLAAAVERNGAGTVVDSSLDALIRAAEKYLVDPMFRNEHARRAKLLAEQEFGMHKVAQQLESAYMSIS